MPIMQATILILVLSVAAGISACSGWRPSAASAAPVREGLQSGSSMSPQAKADAKVDFATQIKPIFEGRCQPCHFNGGKVYATLPFDRPETIRKLGPKLFTRIKDPKEQELIRQFLAQN